MTHLKLRLLLLIMIMSGAIFGQNRIVEGVVFDQVTKEPLVYAIVAVPALGASGYTDKQGYFNLKINPTGEDVRLIFSYIGYKDTAMYYNDDSYLRIGLRADAVLPTVTVRGGESRWGGSGSILSPPVEELQAVPLLFGESDLLKSITLLPGVSTGLEGTANVQIRGGNPSQTNTILDGVTLFNTGHFGGFLSSIDPYGVKGIDIYKGGIPGRYGGRLSGVLDIILRQGRLDKRKIEVSVGTATVRAGSEGAIGESTSYVVGGRYSYPSTLINLFGPGDFVQGESGSKTVSSMFDSSLKIHRNLKNGEISGLFFISGDWGVSQSSTSGRLILDNYRWTTTAAAIASKHRINENFSWINRISYTSYGYSYGTDEKQLIEGRPAVTFSAIDQASKLNSQRLLSRVKYYHTNNIQLEGGVEATRHSFQNIGSQASGGEDNVPTLDDKLLGAEVATFAQADLENSRGNLRGMIALRASTLTSLSRVYFEPRARFSFDLLEPLTLNCGVDFNTQYVHQLSTLNSIFPNDIWILADEEFVPSRANQVYAGLSVNLFKGKLTASVEGFRKKMSELITLNDRSGNLFAIPETWRSTVSRNGMGDVRGGELYVKKNGEVFTGWIAYTFSSSTRTYAGLNSGRSFPYTFDRTHDLAVTGSVKVGNGWSISSTFVYQTGQAITLPIAVTADYFVYGDVNNARVPNYHRLDIGLSRRFQARKSRQWRVLTFSIYNAYSRANPIDFRLEPTTRLGADPQTGQPVLVDGYNVIQRSLFPIVPSVSYKWEFDLL